MISYLGKETLSVANQELLVYGSPETGTHILQTHADIAAAHPVEQPYWEFARGEKHNLFENFRRGPFEVNIGPISAFTSEEIAVEIQSCLDTYLEAGLFPGFPVDDPVEYQRLVGAMICGFDDQRIITSIRDYRNNVMVGGSMLVPGRSDQPVQNLVGSPESVLPTLASLQFSPQNDELDGLSEKNVVSYSRFYRLANSKLPTFGSDAETLAYLKQLSTEMYTAIARASGALSQAEEGRRRDVRAAVIDTHDRSIVKTLISRYGAVVLDTRPTPTLEMLDPQNPLHYHYEMPGIQVVMFDQQTHLTKALDAETQLPPKIYNS